MNEFKAVKEEFSEEAAFEAVRKAKSRITSRERQLEEDKQKEIEYMIKNERDALHAINLNRLLQKSWLELPNAYKIMSKLKDSDNTRLDALLLNNRYS